MKNGFWRCIGATIAFWAIVFFGPAFIMLLNNIGYYFSGGGWGPGSFMYKVLQFFSQPLACLLAVFLAKTITLEEHPVCVLVNTIICTCVCALLILTASTASLMWAMIVSTVACIVAAVFEAKEIGQMIRCSREKNPVE